MKKIRKSLSQIPQKFLGAFGADFTITSSDVFMTFAAVLKNVRPVQPTSRRSKQTIHLRSNSELVQDVLRGRAVVAAEDIFFLDRAAGAFFSTPTKTDFPLRKSC